MVIPTVGLNVFRDAMIDEVDTGIAGTGTGTPASSDTALGTAVGASEITAITTAGVSSFQVSHTIPSTTATGNSFTEWGTLTSTDVLLQRSLTASVSHTASDEITKITTFNLVDR